jgi:hypothetical protein
MDLANLVPRACDPREGTWGSGIIRCRKPGFLAKIELRIPFQRPIRFLPETDYPRASRSFPRISGSGNEIGIWPEPLVAPRVRRALGTRMEAKLKASPSLFTHTKSAHSVNHDINTRVCGSDFGFKKNHPAEIRKIRLIFAAASEMTSDFLRLLQTRLLENYSISKLQTSCQKVCRKVLNNWSEKTWQFVSLKTTEPETPQP